MQSLRANERDFITIGKLITFLSAYQPHLPVLGLVEREGNPISLEIIGVMPIRGEGGMMLTIVTVEHQKRSQ